MKEFNIKITDTDVYINDELCEFSTKMDKEDHETDLDKKAILALADKMGYEATFLFEEMAQRLDEMLDEIDDDNDFLQDLADEAEIEETIGYWLEQLLVSFGKTNVEELTANEIKVEIEEVKGSIQNYQIWDDKHAIATCGEYLKVLEEMLNNKEDN